MSSYKQATVQQLGPIDIDTNFDRSNQNTFSPYPIYMLTTAEHNNGYFTKRKVEVLNVSMDTPTRILWPPPTKLKLIVKSGQI